MPSSPDGGDQDAVQEYLEAYAVVEDVVRAEAILRFCERFVRTGERRGQAPGDTPLLGSDGVSLNRMDQPAPSTAEVRRTVDPVEAFKSDRR